LWLSSRCSLRAADLCPGSQHRRARSWSKVANVLFVESPAGVGFSYCVGGAASCQATDESAADDLAEFFSVFYARYPELLGNKLYVTGESYAGVLHACRAAGYMQQCSVHCRTVSCKNCLAC
jgi:carboxypeptidase C (cathepsin A)